MKSDPLSAVCRHFMESRDWNGLALGILECEYGVNTSWIEEMINRGEIDIQDERYVLNPHIRRLQLSFEQQIEAISSRDEAQICIYPSERLLRDRGYGDIIDKAGPYSKELYCGAAQLDFKFFNIQVMQRYIDDPRYIIFWGSTQGSLSIRDEFANDASLPENAKTILESFGLAIDVAGNRVVATFLRYLAKFENQKQEFWKSFLHPMKAIPVREYYTTAIRGEFPNSISAISAIIREMEIINYICDKHYKGQLFSEIPDRQKIPHYLTPFLKATKYDFDLYAAAVEQITIGNLNNEFLIPYKEDPKFGTIHGFKQFVRRFVLDKNTSKNCLDTIQSVVSARQSVAHNIGENKYGIEFDEMRRELNRKIYITFRSIRESLSETNSEYVKDRFLDEWRIYNY